MQRDATLLRLAYIHGEPWTFWRKIEQARAKANYQASYQLTQWIGHWRCAIQMPMILKHIWETSKVFVSGMTFPRPANYQRRNWRHAYVTWFWRQIRCHLVNGGMAMNRIYHILSNGNNIRIVFQVFQFCGHFLVDGRMLGLLDRLEWWHRSARQWSRLGDAGQE